MRAITVLGLDIAAPRAPDMTTPQSHPLTTDDGRRLAATTFVPPQPHTTLLIGAAMGVPQRFYHPLARWLTERGVAVMTFDYRGMGASRDRTLAKEKVDVLTWAHQDLVAALASSRSLVPETRLAYLGHSLGGQLFPLVKGADEIELAYTVATGSGWWRDNAPPLRRRVPLFWWGAVPLLTPLFGYFPGGRLGMVGDLPAGVVMQWRRWCLDPDYFFKQEPETLRRYRALEAEVHVISMSDDEMMSAASIDRLAREFTRARLHRHTHTPRRGEASVGHFGFFHKERGVALWESYLQRLISPPAASTVSADAVVNRS